jgi:hypothetical protein
MSNNKIETSNGRDTETGRFLPGNSGNGGRPRGARNKLATEFVEALWADFQINGTDAINRVAKEQPHHYLKIIAAILPKELEIALHVNANLFEEQRDFMAAYRLARKVIGLDPEDTPPLIEAKNDRA